MRPYIVISETFMLQVIHHPTIYYHHFPCSEHYIHYPCICLETIWKTSKNLSKLLAFGVRIEPRISKTGSKNINHNIMIFGYVLLIFFCI
jgi:hypothetical protein